MPAVFLRLLNVVVALSTLTAASATAYNHREFLGQKLADVRSALAALTREPTVPVNRVSNVSNENIIAATISDLGLGRKDVTIITRDSVVTSPPHVTVVTREPTGSWVDEDGIAHRRTYDGGSAERSYSSAGARHYGAEVHHHSHQEHGGAHQAFGGGHAEHAGGGGGHHGGR